LAATVEHDVSGLEIAMKDSLSMSSGESGTKLASDFDGLVLRKASNAAEERSQVFPVYKIHREKGLAVDIAHIVDATDVWMRDSASCPHFVAKALPQSFVARGFVGKELHRDGLSEGQIISTVDLAHASLAEKGDDAITPGNETSGKKASFTNLVLGI
jgi:hypothetical protein